MKIPHQICGMQLEQWLESYSIELLNVYAHTPQLTDIRILCKEKEWRTKLSPEPTLIIQREPLQIKIKGGSISGIKSNSELQTAYLSSRCLLTVRV